MVFSLSLFIIFSFLNLQVSAKDPTILSYFTFDNVENEIVFDELENFNGKLENDAKIQLPNNVKFQSAVKFGDSTTSRINLGLFLFFF